MKKIITAGTTIIFLHTIFWCVQAKAQVLIGTPSTVFLTTMNLDIEATDATRTVIQKADGKMGLGTTSPSTLLHINSASSPAVRIVDGTQGAGKVLTSDALGNVNWQTPITTYWGLTGNTSTNDINNFVGTTDAQALHFRVNGVAAGLLDYSSAAQGAYPGANVILGYNAASGITSTLNNASNTNNVIIGYEAGKAQTASYRNTYIGARTGLSTTTAHENVVIGWEAGKALTTGFWNTSLGGYAGNGTTTGVENLSLGWTAGSGVTTGQQNIAIGSYTGGANATGNRNIFLGWTAGASVDGLTNSTAIGNNASVSISNALVLGGTGANAVKVGIGTTSPTTTLHIVGTSPAVKIVDGTEAADRVLTSDASGNASWKSGAKLSLVTGTLPTTGPTIAAATNDTWQVITGSSITLSPGKWMVNMGSTAQLNANNTTDGELWLQFAFNDNTSSFIGSGTADVISGLTGSKIVGGAGRGMILVPVNGCIALNNTTGSNKTYYVWGKKTQFNGSTTANWYDIMGSTNLERYFFALPIN